MTGTHPKHPFKFDLFGGKTFDDFARSARRSFRRFVDQQYLRLHLAVNGETKQDGNTKDMIWSGREIFVSVDGYLNLGTSCSQARPLWASEGRRTRT